MENPFKKVMPTITTFDHQVHATCYAKVCDKNGHVFGFVQHIFLRF